MKRLFTITLSCVVLTMLNVVNAVANIPEYNPTTHTLLITENIPDYNTSGETSWYNYKDEVTTVVVKPGVTRIGNNAFAQFPKLAYISLPDGLLSIGDFAFAETAVEQLVIPSSVQEIGGSAFLWCDKLRTIYLGGNITRLGSTGTTEQDYGAFANCNAVTDIYFYQQNLSVIDWNNTWEFKEDNTTKVHVYENFVPKSGIRCSYVEDIGADIRGVVHGDMEDPNNPYEIQYKWQLDFITAIINSSALNSDGIYLKLIDDLEYDGTENNFTPLGTKDYGFSGTFDGGGHTISGININTDKDYVGVFPYSDNGVIKNLRFDDIHIKTTGMFAGVFAGSTYSTLENITIENSSFEADNNVGPLVGLVEEDITIRNCHVKSDVTVTAATSEDYVYSHAGGLVGRATGGTISGCSSAASVEGPKSGVAGLVGYNKASLTDCLYLGSSVTTGQGYLCYAISENWGDSSVNNCLFTTLSLSDEEGELAFKLTTDDQTSISHNVTTSYGTTAFPGITVYDDMMQYDGKYYVKPVTAVNIAHDASTNLWYKANDDVIRNYSFSMPEEDVYLQVFAWQGTGTESDPYLIYTTDELDFFAYNVNLGNGYDGKYFKLMNDLAYDGVTQNNYSPIGCRVDGNDRSFNGTFDGQGHTVSGIILFVQGENNDNANNDKGLFGIIGESGIVKNVNVDNSSFSGNTVGGIVGRNYGIVENCKALSGVSLLCQFDHYYDNKRWGCNNYGGIVGELEIVGCVRGCVSYATVSYNNHPECWYYGGVVGYNRTYYYNIQYCLYMGNLVEALSSGAISGIGTYSSTDPIPPTSYFTNSRASDSRHQRAYTITLQDGLEIYSNVAASYGEGSYAGVTAYENGVIYYDGVYYAPEGVYNKIPMYRDPNEPFTRTTSFSYNNGTVPQGYEISFSVKDADGNDVEFTQNGAVITISMPASDITVNYTLTIVDFTEGSGTESDPYIIYSVEEMNILAAKVNESISSHYSGVYFELGADLEYDKAVVNNYIPVGYGSGTTTNFGGHFDGKGHSISGINISTENGRQGLFGVVSGGTVKNVWLKDCSIYAGDAVGGIAGYLINDATVENCHVLPDVTIGATKTVVNHGGIVGNNNYGSVIGCSSAALITCGEYTMSQQFGGIVGINGSGTNDFENPTTSTISDCLYYGPNTDVTIYMGAIAGYENTSMYTTLNYSGNYYHQASGLRAVCGGYVDGNEAAYKVSSGTEGLNLTFPSTNTYPYDGIAIFTDGMAFNGAFFGIEDASADFTADYTGTGYMTSISASAGTLTGTENPYNISINTSDVVITAKVFDKWFGEYIIYDDDSNVAGNSNVNTRLLNELLSEEVAPNGFGANVTLTNRTLYLDGDWNTLCLPFDLPKSDPLMVDATVKELDGNVSYFDNGLLILNFIDAGETLKAGTPYLVRWDGPIDELTGTNNYITNPVFKEVLITSKEPSEVSIMDGSTAFAGIYSTLVIPGEDRTILFLKEGNKLYYPNGAMNLNSCRAYFKLLDGLVAGDPANGGMIKSVTVNFGDEGSVTGVLEISDDGRVRVLADDGWYDLSGRKLDSVPTVPGIYINNGKKVIIK